MQYNGILKINRHWEDVVFKRNLYILISLFMLAACGGGGGGSEGGRDSQSTASDSAQTTSPSALLAFSTVAASSSAASSDTISVGSTVVVDGSGSHDTNGDALGYAWTLGEKPTGSTTTLSSASSASTSFVPDKLGIYILRLRVTNSKGATGDASLVLEAVNRKPISIVESSNLLTLVGRSVGLSASLSFDDDGDPLTYSWVLKSKPEGSSVTLSSDTAATFLTPDVAGDYVAEVSVSDGKVVSVSSTTIKAKPVGSTQAIALGFSPLEAQYSKSLESVIMTGTSPDALYTVDLISGVVKTVLLPLPAKALAVSPNGRRAAVAFDGYAVFIDLEQSTLLNTVEIEGQPTEIFLTDDNQAYLTGQTGGQWFSPIAIRVDFSEGIAVNQNVWGGTVWGTQTGVLADKKEKFFTATYGLSPSDFNTFSYSASTKDVTSVADSPYHGDYSICPDLWLDESQTYLFTGCGTYFKTSDATYAGSLGVSNIISLSHSSKSNELLLLTSAFDYNSWTQQLPSTFKRYAGAYFSPQPDMELPTVGGKTSYGINVFHTSSGNIQVFVVQTDSNVLKHQDAKYFVVTR